MTMSAGISSNGFNPSGMFSSLISGGLGLLGTSMSNANAKEMARRQFEYQQQLNLQSYALNQSSLRDSPTNQRIGLERAGYNPIMAIQSGFSFPQQTGGSASLGQTFDYAPNMSNAYKVFNLERRQANAQINNVNQNTALQAQQEETELYKQKEMESQTFLNNVLTQAHNEEIPYIARKAAMEIATGYINAQANHLAAEANQLNAHTAYSMYKLNKGITDYENIPRKALADFIKAHPEYMTISKYSDIIGPMIRDLGIGVGSLKGIDFNFGSKPKVGF